MGFWIHNLDGCLGEMGELEEEKDSFATIRPFLLLNLKGKMNFHYIYTMCLIFHFNDINHSFTYFITKTKSIKYDDTWKRHKIFQNTPNNI